MERRTTWCLFGEGRVRVGLVLPDPIPARLLCWRLMGVHLRLGAATSIAVEAETARTGAVGRGRWLVHAHVLSGGYQIYGRRSGGTTPIARQEYRRWSKPLQQQRAVDQLR